MAKSSTVEFDGAKLKKIFESRGLKMQMVSKDCGYEDSYFSKAIRSGKMAKTAMILLQDRYKIYPEAYEFDKEEVVAVELTPVQTHTLDLSISEDTAKLLHKIIYSAVYEAVRKAWTE